MNGIMKKMLVILMLFSAGYYYAQTTTSQPSPTFLFAQGMFNIEDEQQLMDQENDLRNHPNVKVVRLDKYSNRFFILIQDLDSLSEQELRSWFGPYGSDLTCIQIGVHGLDPVNEFPFVNCTN
jgi:hypothetical protein